MNYEDKLVLPSLIWDRHLQGQYMHVLAAYAICIVGPRASYKDKTHDTSSSQLLNFSYIGVSNIM